MKQILLITFLSFSPLLWTCLFNQGGAGSEVYAQRHEIDSLLKLNSQHSSIDIQKLQTLNQLAELYTWVQIDSALNYSNQAITLAQKLNNKTELVTAYNNKAVSLGHLVLLDEEEKVFPTALAISKSTNNLNGTAETYLNLSQLKKGDERKKLIDEALLLFKQTGNQTGLGKAWFQLGTYYRFQDQDSSLKYFNKAVELFKATGNSNWLSNSNLFTFPPITPYSDFESIFSVLNKELAYSKLSGNNSNTILALTQYGNCFRMKGNYPKAISNYIKALKLAEQMHIVSSQGFILNNIGALYYEIEDYNQAIYYLSQCKNISNGNPDFLFFAYQVLGDAYKMIQNFDSASVNLQEALSIALKTNNQLRLPGCYISLAKLSSETKDFSLTFFYLNQFLNCGNKEMVSYSMEDYYYLLAITIKSASDSILINNKINPSERKSLLLANLLKAYKIIKDRHTEYDSNYIIKELSDVYEQLDNSTKALYFFKEFKNIMDSVGKTGNINTVAKLQIQYDSEKQEQQIALLNKDKALQLEKIEKQKTTRNAFIGGFALVLLLAGVIYNRYRIKQKANREIENTLTHLKNTQEQLVQQGKLAALGKMTSEVAAEIQHPLNEVKILSSENELLAEAYANAKTETERNQILDKLEINFESINQNGKMADGIVKMF